MPNRANDQPSDPILSPCRHLRRAGTAAVTAVLALAAVVPPVSGQAEAAVQIMPHRALYNMSLASTRRSSSVTDVRGKMMFEWADACDGWTIEQRFRLDFQYAEGEEVKMTTNYVTWEAKDGRSYRFNVRKLVNGQLDEEVKGAADLDKIDGLGRAHFEEPEPDDAELPAGTLFPTWHTVALIQQAMAGEKLFSRPVFDGADAEGLTEISAVIGEKTAIKDPSLNKALLGGLPAWPVRMAFFPIKSQSAEPEYEMTLTLLSNGVAQAMTIDYGDFTVNAVLESLEALPKPGC
ncbi:MAG: DUF1849 family protein [Azospirillum sp.]|nr:DUF1849 family protein [Azospirillum sp.]